VFLIEQELYYNGDGSLHFHKEVQAIQKRNFCTRGGNNAVNKIETPCIQSVKTTLVAG
jgi:hypothetical protein